MTKEQVEQLKKDLTDDLNKMLIKLQNVQTLHEKRNEQSLGDVPYVELSLLTLKTAINDVLTDNHEVVDMFDEYKMSYS